MILYPLKLVYLTQEKFMMKVFFPLFWFFVSVFNLLLFILLAFKKHGNLKSSVKTLLLGIVITDFIILSSLFYFGNVYTADGEVSEYNSITNTEAVKPFILLHNSEYEISKGNKKLFSLIYSLINAPKMGTFSLKYPIIFAAAFDFPKHMSLPYGIFIVLLSMLSPIIFGGFLVSYIKALWNFLLYHTLKFFKNIYYFSELNEKSLLLAEDIIKQEKSLIVFCNCNKIPAIFEDRINKYHFIVLTDNEKDLIIHSSVRNKKQYFFEISENTNQNLDTTKSIIKVFDKSKKTFFPNVRVYLFINSSFFDSEKLFSSEHEKFNIFLIDEVKTSIYNLLFEKPLYERINKKDNSLSIAVFGDGVYAKQFFKDAIWASVLGDDYKINISFIDSRADSFKQSLELKCPGIFSRSGYFYKNFKLNFENTNLESGELNKTLLSKIPYPDYIVIDTGADDSNIDLAVYLRIFYNRNSDDFNFTPFIAVRIKDSKTAERLKDMKTSDDMPYELISFGYEKDIYSYDTIINSPIDKLALNCHAAYNQKSDGYHYETEAKAISGCNTSGFEKYSNQAAAIHIKAKLFIMGFDLKPYDDNHEPSEADIKINDKAWKDFDKALHKPDVLECLQKTEKYRWNAFHFMSGWINPTLEKARIYKELIATNPKKHKYVRAKMHACLCDWEEMPQIEQTYDIPFREYDSIFIQQIPSIIGCQKNNPGNIAGAKFLLVEKKNHKGE